MLGSQGLRQVSDPDLVALLRAVHQGALPCPIDPRGLATVGLLRLLDALDILKGLDARAVQAVLVAVLAERRGR